MAKQIKHGEDARRALEAGLDTLANTVKLLEKAGFDRLSYGLS